MYMKTKKRSLLLISLVLLSTLFIINSVVAVWSFALTNSAVYEITSADPGASGDFVITQNWTGNFIETGDAPGSFKDKLVIENSMDPIDVVFNVDENRSDADDLCLDYELDCEIWYEVSSDGGGYKGIIADGEVFTLDPLKNYIWAVINCERFSCPQNISIDAVIIPA
ncbi:hypothetical protein ES703_76781 [subsurface metagenome]